MGISVYSGNYYTIRANMQYIDMANGLGATRLFTSFNVAMGNRLAFDEVVHIVKYAKSKDMDVMVDVSPEAFKLVGADIVDLRPFYQMGVSAIRCDYGSKDRTNANGRFSFCFL
ncbi:MupG family TIM beta-alpha barrel fold protein [Caldicoprobacter algeriensis]|uniref:MupG family TIM beta-alpha barrel fold protein n=1 Tax=Caldicoprobacter algeriensis TaxID=699281 RepID=UPI002079487A